MRSIFHILESFRRRTKDLRVEGIQSSFRSHPVLDMGSFGEPSIILSFQRRLESSRLSSLSSIKGVSLA